MKLLKRATISGLGIALVGLTGCTVYTRPRDRVVYAPPPPPPQQEVVVQPSPPPAGGEIIIETAPPPPRYEERGYGRPGEVWADGFWFWEGGRYAWHPGHWDRPPRPGVVWVAPHYEPRGRGYVYIEGRWR